MIDLAFATWLATASLDELRETRNICIQYQQCAGDEFLAMEDAIRDRTYLDLLAGFVAPTSSP
jgi:hypothetical protein